MNVPEYSSSPSSSDQLPKSEGALSSAASGAHRLVDKAANVAEDTARKAAPAIDRAAELSHRAVDSAAAAVAPAANWLSEQAAALNAKQKELVSNARDYVAANPLMALGIAIAAGFMISRIVRK